MFKNVLWKSMAALLLVLCFAGCGGAPAGEVLAAAPPDSQPVAVTTVTQEPIAVPEATAEPTPEPTPEPPRSNTTGKVLDDGAPYRPVIVSIENASAARPQTGLMNADIVYEFLVESHITRFQALFSDNVPSVVGPVRSARYYFIDLQQEWNGMYAHVGYAVLSGKYARGWGDCAIHISGGSQFFRSKQSGIAEEHTMYLHLQQLIADEYGDHVPNRDERFLFGEKVAYEGTTLVNRVDVPFTGSTDIYYTYDAATGRMLRHQDGKAFMTKTESGDGKTVTEQVAVNNLIIQHCKYGQVPTENQPGEDKGRRTVELTGTGACEYIINGQLLTGTWERATLKDYTRYYLDDGTLVTLEVGNTWIAVIPRDAQIEVS